MFYKDITDLVMFGLKTLTLKNNEWISYLTSKFSSPPTYNELERLRVIDDNLQVFDNLYGDLISYVIRSYLILILEITRGFQLRSTNLKKVMHKNDLVMHIL